MRQKRSQAQIGKESSGVSSDFNPLSLLSCSDHHARATAFPHILIRTPTLELQNNPLPPSPSSSSSTPYKRSPPSNQSSQLPHRAFSILKSAATVHNFVQCQENRPPFSISIGARSAAFWIARRLNSLLGLRFRLRLFLLLSLPFFYFFVSHPSGSFFLDFFTALVFSSVLFFSLNLALPRLPSIRLFLARSFPITLSSTCKFARSPLPVFWSIGSRTGAETRATSGCWVQAYSNGDVYEGEFHKGKCSGSGVYYYYMSGRYEGDWVDGRYEGHGVETWARGSRYRGQYWQGHRHGLGAYRFHTGDVYAGEWCKGQSHGSGSHTCDDGSRYLGDFKQGVKHGFGHYHFRNGDTYAGEYFNNKMHGFGVYCFANGHRYEGAWHEGRRQGLGMYTFSSGEIQSGLWNKGTLDVPSTQSIAFPTSPVAVYHSRVLNAVQEARHAAEKAYGVVKVDERVNKAVAAANRAANAGRVAAVKAVRKQLRHGDDVNFSIPLLSSSMA